MTAEEYMRKAVTAIDELFGEGYAKKNPQLVGAFMQTAADDYGAGAVSFALEDIANAIENAAGTMADAATSAAAIIAARKSIDA
jgi:hypothetical protein